MHSNGRLKYRIWICLFLLQWAMDITAEAQIDESMFYPIRPAFLQEVRAILDCYSEHIDSATWDGGEVVFHGKYGSVYYRNGKMLSASQLEKEKSYDSIFYPYIEGPLTELAEEKGFIPKRSEDFRKMMFGNREKEIRKHCKEIRFLHHMAFVNKICIPDLERVEKMILQLAETDPETRQFVEDIRILFSFQQKRIVGSENASYHGYGLAIDLVPASYQKKNVYWKWSGVYYPDWHRIPLEDRWSPPQSVIDAFEANGFVWGGKWTHFDNIHFEYRPEILFLSRLRKAGD